jgi:hypothetical protein
VHHWLRVLFAASAGIGAWDLAGRLERRMGWSLSPAVRAGAVALLVLPSSLPYWWDPWRMDPSFQRSVDPLPELLRAPTTFLRTRTEPDAVVASDPDLARYVAALGARRVLISGGMNASADASRRWLLLEALLRDTDGRAVRPAAAEYGVRYLAVTPALLKRHPPVTLADLDRRPHLRRVHLTGDPHADFVVVYRLEPDVETAGR